MLHRTFRSSLVCLPAWEIPLDVVDFVRSEQSLEFGWIRRLDGVDGDRETGLSVWLLVKVPQNFTFLRTP